MEKIVIFYKNCRKYGGQEKVIWNLIHYLAKNGFTIDMYVMQIMDKPKDKNITVKKVFIPNLGLGLKTLIFAMYAYIKAKDMDNACIFGFGKTFYQDIYRSGGGVHKYYFKRAKLKYSSKLDKFFYILKKMFSLSHWINIWIENKTFATNKLKAVIVPSEFVRKQILDVFPDFDKEKIFLVRNDVEIERFDYNKKAAIKKIVRDKLSLSRSTILFSFISTNHRLKGLEYLLGACYILKNRGYDFNLLIAGNGDYKHFKRIIKKYGLDDNVRCLGVVKDIEDIYYASDFLVYPSLFDTFGLVVLEAMACGTPVFCSAYAGASEILKDKDFIIENPQSVQEIAKKIIYAVEHRNLWEDWSKKVSEIAKKYSNNVASKKIVELIHSIYSTR